MVGMVVRVVRTGPPRLARDNGQGQGGHAGYVPAPPRRGRGGLSPIHHISSLTTYISFFFFLALTGRALRYYTLSKTSSPASSLASPY